ncbi:hypothetical protein J2Z35_002103 [Acetoanaerobium pronyense]|uniref:Putative Flp pilus-assembly TadG-like N-terminal domain-containing protein n=1 Tax=Acetoanaerobium pronyense TaxID=1482736 RepID=A0ABS4KKJ3_9FIRM|nr:pilus assembly protein TadG-related protein [Acetoanaerobium pronyense]MBP2028302.1 hypothetical protein [Acetoanaerobium pronyense]
MKKFIFRFKEFRLKENLDERGSILVIIAITMVVLLGMTALVTDVGAMALNRNRLQAAADSAALAGAQELPFDTALARSVAEDYLNKNINNSFTSNIAFSESNQKITVEVTRNVEFSFARILGINDNDVNVSAAAINAPVKSVVSGLRPFAILHEDAEKIGLITLKVGDKKNADKNDRLGPGNFGAVGLLQGHSDNGANVYRDNIHSGTTGNYWIGKQIDTETGNMAGPTEQGLDSLFNAEGSPATIIVPIVDELYVNGKKESTIVGFAAFELREEENTVKDEVSGRFVKFVTLGLGDTGAVDYGVRAVNLVE